jgi:hypothetical protein
MPPIPTPGHNMSFIRSENKENKEKTSKFFA